jgi:DNA-binding PadR family transcriptional regulator
MSKRLPEITHLQFLVLEALAERETSGRALRAMLATYGITNSAPAFYQMMSRLEEAGLADGWYDQRVVDGQHIKERCYRLAKAGKRTLADTRSFYLDRLAAAKVVKKPSHA